MSGQKNMEDHISEFEDSYSDEGILRGEIFREKLGNIPRRPTVILPSYTSVSKVIHAMNELRVGCALITRNEKLAGIFTERDVLRKVANSGSDIEHTPVENFMTNNPDTLPLNSSIAYAIHKMSTAGYRHIPLTDREGRPTGVVAVRDIISWMVDLFQESLLNLPPDPELEMPKKMDGG